MGLRAPGRPWGLASRPWTTTPAAAATRPLCRPQHCHQGRLPTSPRSELAAKLRLYLSRAAVDPGVQDSSELQALLEQRVGLGEPLFARLFSECRAWQLLAVQPELSEVDSNLDGLLAYHSAAEVVKLLTAQPLLLTAQVRPWLDFLREFGFTPLQVKNLVLNCPELLVKGSLAKAGGAILRLRELGFDNDEVRHRVIAYCPQVLMMEAPDIDMLIRLWSKFKAGVDADVWGDG